jgi:hypothetical protein
MKKAKFVQVITIKDPDTGNMIDMTVYKHENEGMFAVDSSYIKHLDDISDNDDDITCRIPDPFGDNDSDVISLVELHED